MTDHFGRVITGLLVLLPGGLLVVLAGILWKVWPPLAAVPFGGGSESEVVR